MPIASSVWIVRLRSDPATSAVVRSKYEPVSSGMGPAVVAGDEVEELHLRGDVEREAAGPGPLEVAPQHLAGVALERSTVEVEDVAEDPGFGGVGIGPREQLEAVGVGRARTSLSCTREKPSIAEPSNVMPSSSAFSSSTGLMAKLLSWPSTSVNHSRTRRTPRSSTERRT